MPIYEYKCLDCGSLFEILQKVHDPPLKKCIKCGGKIQKTITAPAIQFKGSGWYITDYAAKGGKTEESIKSSSDSPDKPQKKDQKQPKKEKKE